MKLASAIRKLEKEICFVGMLLVLLIAFMTSADVFGRYLLASPIPGVPETAAMLFAIAVFISLAHTQAEKGHVRVEVLVNLLPRRAAHVVEFIALLLVLLITGLIAWSTGKVAIHSIIIQEVKFGAVPVPLWPAKLMFPIGMILLFLQIMVDEVGHIRSLRKDHNKHIQQE